MKHRVNWSGLYFPLNTWCISFLFWSTPVLYNTTSPIKTISFLENVASWCLALHDVWVFFIFEQPWNDPAFFLFLLCFYLQKTGGKLHGCMRVSHRGCILERPLLIYRNNSQKRKWEERYKNGRMATTGPILPTDSPLLIWSVEPCVWMMEHLNTSRWFV